MRAVTAVPGHAIFGVFMGYFYGYAKLSDYWGRDEDRKAYLALSVVVPILLHGCYDFLAFAQEGNSRFTLLFYAYLIALYVFGIRRVNRSSRDDRRVTRETVFDYFRRSTATGTTTSGAERRANAKPPLSNMTGAAFCYSASTNCRNAVGSEISSRSSSGVAQW